MGTACHSVSGNPAIVLSPAVAPVESLKFHFLPSQEGSGDPSTSNVRNIVGRTSLNGYKAGEDVSLYNAISMAFQFAGKNLLNPVTENILFKNNKVTATPGASGEVTVYFPGGATNCMFRIATVSKAMVGKTYCYSGTNTEADRDVFVVSDADGSNRNVKWTTVYTVQEADVGKELCVRVWRNTQTTITFSNLQVEEGSTPTTFEPYTNVCYGGWADPAKGELTVEYVSKTTTWGQAKIGTPDATTGYQWSYVYFDDPIITNGNGASSSNSFCNVGKMTWTGPDAVYDHFYLVYASQVGKYRANVILDGDTPDNTEIQVVAKLVTPYTVPLTSQQINTLRGTTTFWSEANDTVEVEYEVIDSSEMVKAKKRAVAAAPHLVYDTVPTAVKRFRTDRVSPLKNCIIVVEPTQEGTGDPALDNRRNIVGYNKFGLRHTGKNLAYVIGYSAQNISSASFNDMRTSNGYGTSISTLVGTANQVVITQTETGSPSNPSDYRNGYFEISLAGIEFGKTYKFSFEVENIVSNPLDVQLINMILYSPQGLSNGNVVVEGNRVIWKYTHLQNPNAPSNCGVEVRNCGMSFTIKNVMLTEFDELDQSYEPFVPVLGKNIARIKGFSGTTGSYNKTNSYGTSLNTTSPGTGSVVITQTNASESPKHSYRNGYFCVDVHGLEWNKSYDVSFRISNIVSNPLNAALNELKLVTPYGNMYSVSSVNDDRVVFANFKYTQNMNSPYITAIDVRNCGMSFTMSDFMVTEVGEDQTYVPCLDNEYLVEFPETFYAGGFDPTVGGLALSYAGKTDVLSNYNEKIVYDNGYTRYRFDFVPYAVNTNANQKCDILPYSWQAQGGGAHFYAYTVSETSASRILLYVPTGTDESTQWTAIAELTHPAVYQIDPQQIKTLRGNNVFSVEGNSAIGLRYWTH